VTGRTVTFLLIDDDKIDAMRIANPMIDACNGIKALKHLRGENGHEAVPQPRLVLLDLNIPKMDGIEFLEELQGDPCCATW
jgi:CheY-like chemotaxis protein